MNKYIILLFTISTISFVTAGLLKSTVSTKPVISQNVDPFLYDQIPLKDNEYSSIVRLESDDGRFFCSGVVITNELVLTATHCVIEEDMNGSPTLTTTEFNIVSEKVTKKRQLKVKAKAWAGNARLDYALVKGNFKRFKKATIDYSNTAMFRISNNIVSCGFPVGSTNSVCYPLKKRTNDNLAKGFSYGFIGFLYPGMSGGPVVDRNVDIVFGVNSAVDRNNDELVIAPIIGLKELIEQTNKMERAKEKGN